MSKKNNPEPAEEPKDEETVSSLCEYYKKYYNTTYHSVLPHGCHGCHCHCHCCHHVHVGDAWRGPYYNPSVPYTIWTGTTTTTNVTYPALTNVYYT